MGILKNNQKVANSNLLITKSVPKKGNSHLSVGEQTNKHSVDSRSDSAVTKFDADNLPDINKYEGAPEISHLRIHRDGIEDLDPTSSLYTKRHEKRSWCTKNCQWLIKCCSVLSTYCRKSEVYKGLDDLDPILPRTIHSVDYIKTLAEEKHGSKIAILKSSDSNPNIQQERLLHLAYKSAFEGLVCLSKANELFKQAILLLTFTQYSNNPLGSDKQNIIRGKTVMGSYAWLATYIMQQLQFDAELEVNGYASGEMKEILRSHERCVCQSLYVWEAMLHTIEVVEQTHNFVEKIFTDMVRTIGEQGEEALSFTTRHLKECRSNQRKEELEKLNTYDSRRNAKTWAKFSQAPLRIIMKDERTKASSVQSWVGFDVLPPTTKFYILKLLLRQIEQIGATVVDQIEQIDFLLHSGSLSRNKKHRKIGPTSVLSFEDGVFLMNKHLEESAPATWSHEHIHDFLEVDKISLDTLDLLTLSTATLRTLTYETRQILHVTYETTRDLDYLECKVMNSYEDIVDNCKSDFPAMWEKAREAKDNMKNKGTNSLHKVSGSGKKPHKSRFDVEESRLDGDDAQHWFERSIYQDIIKELPITCLHGAIYLTLQDAEEVFTESSHDMLSNVVHE